MKNKLYEESRKFVKSVISFYQLTFSIPFKENENLRVNFHQFPKFPKDLSIHSFVLLLNQRCTSSHWIKLLQIHISTNHIQLLRKIIPNIYIFYNVLNRTNIQNYEFSLLPFQNERYILWLINKLSTITSIQLFVEPSSHVVIKVECSLLSKLCPV